jgi:hypothetical protein
MDEDEGVELGILDKKWVYDTSIDRGVAMTLFQYNMVYSSQSLYFVANKGNKPAYNKAIANLTGDKSWLK